MRSDKDMLEQKADVYKPSGIILAVLSRDRVRKVNNNGAVQACRVVDNHDVDKDMPAQLPPLRAKFSGPQPQTNVYIDGGSVPAWLHLARSSQLHSGAILCICRTQAIDMRWPGVA